MALNITEYQKRAAPLITELALDFGKINDEMLARAMPVRAAHVLAVLGRTLAFAQTVTRVPDAFIAELLDKERAYARMCEKLLDRRERNRRGGIV